eukprot:6177661-Pleurochrysis_carterae.AAC.2
MAIGREADWVVIACAKSGASPEGHLATCDWRLARVRAVTAGPSDAAGRAGGRDAQPAGQAGGPVRHPAGNARQRLCPRHPALSAREKGRARPPERSRCAQPTARGETCLLCVCVCGLFSGEMGVRLRCTRRISAADA